MKKILAIFAIALLTFSCAKEVKIGYVDVEEVLKEYKGTKDAEKQMNKKSDDLKKQLDALAQDYQKKVADYYAKAQKMSAKARQQAEQGLMQQQDQLKKRQQEAQINVQKEGQEMMDEINEKVEDFVADYAKTNGYSYVLGTSDQTKSVLYGASESDLTDAVLEALNDAYKKGDTSSSTEKDSVK